MNREIKFRAWDKKDNLMMVVRTILFQQDLVWLAEDETKDAYPVYRDTENIELMQYTGLYDSTATEFCEGDILEDDGEYWVVDFYDGAFWVVAIGGTAVAELLIENDYMDIVGNIYENPELLEDAE